MQGQVAAGNSDHPDIARAALDDHHFDLVGRRHRVDVQRDERIRWPDGRMNHPLKLDVRLRRELLICESYLPLEGVDFTTGAGNYHCSP
jgi:hypothetical protein